MQLMIAQPLKLAPPLVSASVLAHERKNSPTSPTIFGSSNKGSGVWYLLLVIPDKSVEKISTSSLLDNMMIAESTPYRISRRFEDFLNFHTTLLQQLQAEGQFRDFKLVQGLPELTTHRSLFSSSKSVIEGKRVLLDKYVKELLSLPSSVTKRLLVSSFFGLWSTDVNLPPVNPQYSNDKSTTHKQSDGTDFVSNQHKGPNGNGVTLERNASDFQQEQSSLTISAHESQNPHNQSNSKLSKFLPAIFTISRKKVSHDGADSNNQVTSLSPRNRQPQSIQSTRRFGRKKDDPEIIDLDEKWLSESKERRLSRQLLTGVAESSSRRGNQHPPHNISSSSNLNSFSNPSYLTLIPPPNLHISTMDLQRQGSNPGLLLSQTDVSSTSENIPSMSRSSSLGKSTLNQFPLLGKFVGRNTEEATVSEYRMQIGPPLDVKTTNIGGASNRSSPISPTVLERPSITTMVAKSSPPLKTYSLNRRGNPSQLSSPDNTSPSKAISDSDQVTQRKSGESPSKPKGVLSAKSIASEASVLSSDGVVTIPRRGSSRHWETMQRKQQQRQIENPVSSSGSQSVENENTKSSSFEKERLVSDDSVPEEPQNSSTNPTMPSSSSIPLLPLYSKHSLGRNTSTSTNTEERLENGRMRSTSLSSGTARIAEDKQNSLFASLKRQISRGRKNLLQMRPTSRNSSAIRSDEIPADGSHDSFPSIPNNYSSMPQEIPGSPLFDAHMTYPPRQMEVLSRSVIESPVENKSFMKDRVLDHSLHPSSSSHDAALSNQLDLVRVAAQQATLDRLEKAVLGRAAASAAETNLVSQVIVEESYLMPIASQGYVRGPDDSQNGSVSTLKSLSPSSSLPREYEMQQAYNTDTTVLKNNESHRRSIVAKRSLAALRKATERRQADRDLQNRTLIMVPPNSTEVENKSKRRSLYQMDSPVLFRNHTLSSGQAGTELDRHFIFVRARIEDDYFIKCRVSRTIGFDQLMDRLELKFGLRSDLPANWKTQHDETSGEKRLCLAGAGYIDSDENFLDIEDEGDWLVCLEEAVTEGEIDIYLFVLRQEGGIYPSKESLP